MDKSSKEARREFVRNLAFIYENIGIDLFEGGIEESLESLIKAFNGGEAPRGSDMKASTGIESPPQDGEGAIR